MRCFVVAMAAVVFASGARAALVCDTLGEAGRFDLVAQKQLATRVGGMNQNNLFPVGFIGDICMETGQLNTIEVQARSGQANVVATRATRSAIRFSVPPPSYSYPVNPIDGNVVTGGGAVSGPPPELRNGGVIDTTGTQPIVGRCTQAMTDARAASAAFAALTPTHVMGHVRVRVGEQLDIDVRGGAVIQMDSLTMDGVKGQCPGYRNICDCFDQKAYLYLIRNPGDQVVINVGDVSLGNCARAYFNAASETKNTVVNVPGRGRRIRFGFEVAAYDGFNVLAPERSFVTEGAGLDTETAISSLWVDRAKLEGFTYQSVNGSPCP